MKSDLTKIVVKLLSKQIFHNPSPNIFKSSFTSTSGVFVLQTTEIFQKLSITMGAGSTGEQKSPTLNLREGSRTELQHFYVHVFFLLVMFHCNLYLSKVLGHHKHGMIWHPQSPQLWANIYLLEILESHDKSALYCNHQTPHEGIYFGRMMFFTSVQFQIILPNALKLYWWLMMAQHLISHSISELYKRFL